MKHTPTRCTARKRKNGEPCKAWAVKGLDKCTNHCGLSKEQREKRGAQNIALRTVKEVAAVILKESGIDVSTEHPLDGLLASIRIDRLMVTVIEQQVHDLTVGDGGLYGDNHSGDAVPHVLLEELRKWNDLHARHTKLALDAGIDERKLRMEEALATKLLTAQDAALRAAGFDEAQIKRARGEMVRELRLIEGGKKSA